MDQETSRKPFIVVGVDGSPCSIMALRWAIGQARLSGARVEAVAAWQEPSTYGLAFGFSPAWPDANAMSTAAAESLDVAVTEAIGPADGSPVVTARVIQGHPAQALTDAARGALMLVVGRRGHGALRDLLLGSVSHYCVQHASCPVVVVAEGTEGGRS
jgi:nucleotide-binding universal stress UspA family protein